MKNKQNIELEYKFWVKDGEALVRVLDTRAFSKIARQYQSSVMFDNPSRIMQTTNGRIRVRILGDTGDKTLTYKKPLSPINGAKREIEYEISFRDPKGEIEKILGAMEFTPTTSYERYQTGWEIDGAHVTLDEYPYADIIEIEGKKEIIEKLAKEFGFDIKEGLTKPVDTLFQEWRKKKGLPFKPHMRFNDFDK
ncbi:MAG: class IV adenylate cyclase [Candidatus Shapirobacteria bacterium]|jgi:predicted adenylyl cyclase CyaB|nr:class IV adenylate cyclase [Candidatus Shapirobacteria bacterium]MDD5073944.1 class IV adenylate cyclase [Candidatus Shapirobacteria bacterium]MDD5481894.1 class IV adenylate cyclase [Candidatus Shapirobacteria bacterium]